MVRRSKPAPLTVRVSFEATRISIQCLIDAYDKLVPTTRRRPRPARRPEFGEATPIARGGEYA